jgi:hypothetical protein
MQMAGWDLPWIFHKVTRVGFKRATHGGGNQNLPKSNDVTLLIA